MRHRLFAHAYWLIGGLAIVMVLLPVMAPGAFYLRVAALVYINAIAVIGLNLLMGYAGQVSLGHAGFFGIGAYAVGLGPAVFRLPVWASLLAGVALSGVVAFIVGRPILKLRGFYLAVATLGLGLLIWMFLNNQSDLTGGPNGMQVRGLCCSAGERSGLPPGTGFPPQRFYLSRTLQSTSSIVLLVGRSAPFTTARSPRACSALISFDTSFWYLYFLQFTRPSLDHI